MLSGTFLIVVGVVLIVAQFWLYATTPEIQLPTRELNLGAAGAEAQVKTTYVGLALVVAGAFLQAVALVVRRKEPEA